LGPICKRLWIEALAGRSSPKWLDWTYALGFGFLVLLAEVDKLVSDRLAPAALTYQRTILEWER
jgi:hypothetical protein